VVSGGRHYVAQASRFLTGLDENPQFESTLTSSSDRGGALGEELRAASINLDAGIRDLTMQPLSPGIYYFHLLVSAFHSACVLPRSASSV